MFLISKKIKEAEKDRPRLDLLAKNPILRGKPVEGVNTKPNKMLKNLLGNGVIENLTKKMANYLNLKQNESSKKMRKYLIMITLIPLTLAIILVSVISYFTLSFYFNQMMSNSAEIIIEELKIIQNNMLANAKNYISIVYETQLDEIIFLRNAIVYYKNEEVNGVRKIMTQKLDNQAIECWKTQDLDYKSMPFCVDMTNMNDFSTSDDQYRKLVGKANGIFNAHLVVRRDFSEFKKWAKEEKEEVSVILSLFPLMQNFKDNNPNQFDNDEITYIGHSKKGIFARNFFNYQGPGTYSKIPKSDCQFGINSDIDSSTIYYDPRCRKWFNVVIDFLTKYSQNFKLEKLNKDNIMYPLITSDPYKQVDDSQRVTICSVDQFDSKKKLIEMDIFVICKDIFLDKMIEFVSESYSRMIIQYLGFLSYDSTVKNLLENFNRIDEEKKKGTLKEKFPFTTWCKTLKTYSKDMGWFVLYLTKDLEYKILLDVDGFYLTPTDGKYKKFDTLLSELRFNNSDLSKITITKEIGTGKDKTTVYLSSVGYEREEKWIEWVKMGFLLPEGNMVDWAVKQTQEASKSILISSLIAYSIVILTLVVSSWIVYRFATSVTKQLAKIIFVAEMIKEKIPFIKESIKLWETYEISNLYISFIQLDKLINSAFEYSNLNQESDVAIKLTVSTKIFNTLGNFHLLGTLYNNLGNVFFKLGDYPKAIENYEKAIDNAVDLFEGKLNSHGKEITEFFDRKYHRMFNLALAKKRLIEKKGFKTYSELEEVKSIANSVSVSDMNRDINYGRQILCFCMISWASRLRKDLDASDIALSSIGKILKSVKARDLYCDYPDFLLQQEVRYEKAMNDFQKGKLRKAIYIIVAGLKRDTCFDLGQRKKFLRALFEMVDKAPSLKITDGMLKLHKRYLSRTSKHYILLALDYSRSMRNGGKLENSVKALLKIWDKYTKPEDKIAYVRFNLNLEKVFEFQAKYINEFTKRHQIEQSYKPRDRTALYDALEGMLDMFKLVPKLNTKKFMVVITDGDDKSSLKQEKEINKKLTESGVTLIIAGLGVSESVKGTLEGFCKHTPAGVYVDPIKGNLDHLVQVLTSFSTFESYSLLNQEDSI